MNAEIATGEISYDVEGISTLCERVGAQFADEASMAAIRETYVPELRDWLTKSI